MKSHFIKLAAIIAIAVIWYVWRQHVLAPPNVPAHASSNAAATDPRMPVPAPASSAPAAPAPRSPSPHVRQVSPADRQKLVDQIAAAHAARVAHPPATAPAPAGATTLEQLPTPVVTALEEAIPFLAACYEQTTPEAAKAGKTAVAMLTVSNDPDIGAVLDADQILDGNQAPLDSKLDACLRSTMQTLQLPPLAGSDSVKLQYSFAFDGK